MRCCRVRRTSRASDEVLSNSLSSGDRAQGDYNYDGVVDITDLDIWLANSLDSVGF